MNSKLLISVVAATLLAACGGGGNDDAAPPAPVTQVPESAMASSAAMVNFLKSMQAEEGTEPLSMSPTAAPASDTDEPLPGT